MCLENVCAILGGAIWLYMLFTALCKEAGSS